VLVLVAIALLAYDLAIQSRPARSKSAMSSMTAAPSLATLEAHLSRRRK